MFGLFSVARQFVTDDQFSPGGFNKTFIFIVNVDIFFQNQKNKNNENSIISDPKGETDVRKKRELKNLMTQSL